MRRRLKSSSEFQLTKTTGDIARNRKFQKPFETSKAKRVRFNDAETDVSSRGHGDEGGAPKTSEYAYFRRVKDGAVNGHFRTMPNENKQSKSPKVNYLRTQTCEASEKFDLSMDGLNFSISEKSTGPSGLEHFVSPPPPVRKYVKSYEIRREELTQKNKTRSPLLTETITPVGQSVFSSLHNHASEKSENQCIEKGFFSEKRKRLCQWIAQNTSSEVGKLHGKGSDLTSLLLCRLLPKGNENNDLSKGDADESSKSLIIHESDNMEKDVLKSRRVDCDKDLSKLCSERPSEIKLREWEGTDSDFPPNYRKENDLPLSCKIDCHMDISKNSPERSSEIVARDWGSFDSGFPSNYCKESDFPNKTMYPDRSSATRHGFSFCLPFESFRSFGAFHLKDFDEFGPIIGCGREGPNRHSLEWDFGEGKERIDHGTGKEVCHRLANVWNVDQQMTMDNMLDIKEFSPSPLFSSRYLFKPLPNYVSTGCLMPEVEPNLDDLEYAIVEPGHFSLTFPKRPKFIPLAEDGNAENILSNSNTIFSHRDRALPKNMVWDGTPRSEFWLKCLPAPKLSAEDHLSDFHAWQLPQTENHSFSLPLLKEAPGDCTPRREFWWKCLPAPELSAVYHSSDAWQFPRNENHSFSRPLLKEAPVKPGTSFGECAFDHCRLSSALHSHVDAFMNRPLLLNHVSHDILDQELYSDDYYNELGYRI